MTNPDHDADAAAAASLRQQAEEKVRSIAASAADADPSPEEARYLLHELRVHQAELEMQNEHLRQAQMALDNVRARYFDLYDLAPVGYVTVSETGLILEANLTVTTLLGKKRHTLLERPFSQNIIHQDQDIYYLCRKQLFATGDPQTCELRMRKKDDTIFWAQLVAILAQDAAGEAVCRITLSDITEHKLQESAAALAARLIVRINTPGDCRACIEELTTALHDWSGCEAVGIRLREGDDYPYYETRGFPPAFVALENHLCACHPNGELVRDSDGRPVLECMCGNVLCGRIDPRKPFFTTSGSFWTNSTTALLASTTEADRQSHTRNRCNHAGYESVALIPLRAAGQVFGLLQFNDHQTNRFTPVMIAQFEKMADSLATAMAQRQAAAALASSQAELQAIYENAPVMMCLVDTDRHVRYANAALTSFMGGAPEKHAGGYAFGVLGCIKALDDPRGCGFGPNCQSCALRLAMEDTFTTGTVHHDVEFATTLVRDGQPRNIVLLAATVLIHTGGADRLLLCLHDITERLAAEVEKDQLEVQLQQAQKMESVGRLAGGVAHDFNNMLGVILGHAELALAAVDAAKPIHADLEEIRQAATRSADLTRQLLAFARKQTITPKVLDLNDTLAGMLTMLKRLIGEDIEFVWMPGADLWPVKMDASQLDQMLANLCVNSRDAIHGTGKITVTTANHTIDAKYCVSHAGVVPGDYVRITVSDSGCGMDPETLGHIFEPFFTTKDVGVGTGLGLATVYGAVKQNGGFIDVCSELGKGTTFTIYLLRHQGQRVPVRTPAPAEPVVCGHETILLVEDELSILKLTARMLGKFGYTVLMAGTPGEAVRLAQEHAGDIDLLMTDVVMPEMNGRDLAKNLRALYPELKRLFMSGYTADIIAIHGVVEQGVCFIQKPFTMQELAAKVRNTLDAENA